MGMSSLLGVPTFNYEINNLTPSPWNILYNSLQNNFVSVALYYNWDSFNICGLTNFVSFSILAAFNLNLKNGTVI
jgi:hypothetical protein